MLRKRIVRRELFVQIDAQAGRLIRPERAVADLRCAREHLACCFAELVLFLDPEVLARQVEMQIGRMTYRRYVAGPMPGGAHTEELAERRQLACDAEPTNGG